uniref:Uncharacterized protein n=1 Tax=Arundo donax TaxID=35708 RepID=A0A0A9BG71_ARUDO
MFIQLWTLQDSSYTTNYSFSLANNSVQNLTLHLKFSNLFV